MVPGRLVEADFGACLTGIGAAEGVFARGGGARDAEAYNSSRYRSPRTRKGRPYSSSHLSRVFFSSASTFGSSFAIRLRIFSSRKSFPGSRRSPLLPRAIKRDASWLDAARSSRSLISSRCRSIFSRVGSRCILRASSRAISAS